MNIRWALRFLFVAILAVVARAASAGTYEVQVTREVGITCRWPERWSAPAAGVPKASWNGSLLNGGWKGTSCSSGTSKALAFPKVFSGNCIVQVRSGWSGSNFPAAKISEEGRQCLLGKLKAMVDSPDQNQIRNLFAGAHMDMDPHSTIEGWVKAFVDKVREIERTGPCE